VWLLLPIKYTALPPPMHFNDLDICMIWGYHDLGDGSCYVPPARRCATTTWRGIITHKANTWIYKMLFLHSPKEIRAKHTVTNPQHQVISTQFNTANGQICNCSNIHFKLWVPEKFPEMRRFTLFQVLFAERFGCIR